MTETRTRVFWMDPERRASTLTEHGPYALQAATYATVKLEVEVWRSADTGSYLILWRSDDSEWHGAQYADQDLVQLVRSLPLPQPIADSLLSQVAMTL